MRDQSSRSFLTQREEYPQGAPQYTLCVLLTDCQTDFNSLVGLIINDQTLLRGRGCFSVNDGGLVICIAFLVVDNESADLNMMTVLLLNPLQR